MNLKELYNIYKNNYKVSIDTRTILKDSIFFAISGDNFNANEFAIEALDKGAILSIVDEKKYADGKSIIYIENPLKMLQKLAEYHRSQLSVNIIGITGSNGKTTTKELLKQVLCKKYNTMATQGNLNNHIGVPLTLLSIKPKYQIAIVEMGANHCGEIAFLSQMINPDYGYITNFGKAHLEGFGGLKGVIKGKSELYKYLKDKNKKAFVNQNDDTQVKQAKAHKLETINFGGNSGNIFIQLLDSFPFVRVRYREVEISSKLTGKFNFHNIAAAIAIGEYFRVSPNEIKDAIEQYNSTNNRCQIIYKNENKIILDAYNANPTSMRNAIENFANFSGSKYLILGDMYELGKATYKEHQVIVDIVLKIKFDKVLLVGENFSAISVTDENVYQFKSYEDLKRKFSIHKVKNTNILIKGSRAVALERILDLF